MSGLRLRVIQGPDAGLEVSLPDLGGAVGRDVSSEVRLSDLTVSRAHCRIEPGPGGLRIVDPRGKTRVNGGPGHAHLLVPGDELHVGKTVLRVISAPEPPKAAPHVPRRLTLDLPTDELFAVTTGVLRDRATRHLAALAHLGQGLTATADRQKLFAAACEGLFRAVDAARVDVFMTSAAAPQASATPASPLALEASFVDSDSVLPPETAPDVVERVLVGRRAIAMDGPDGASVMWAPIPSIGEDGRAPGLVSAVAPSDRPWIAPDLELCACVAQLIGAAIDGIRARETLLRGGQALVERLGGAPRFVGASAAAERVRASVRKVAPSDTTVLILGESGAGKELVAASIHDESRRKQGPFVCVNCAALPESLVESELFGHEKGAFTGAVERRVGRFEQAHGGTLFLDEVGEIPPKIQAKFLRALEERTIERVGSGRPIPVDVRVIAATNRDLRAMMETGTFREDLYYRLGVIQLHVPPLRERAEDIPALATHFAERLSAAMGRRFRGFSQQASSAIQRYGWPGNARELRNAVEHALVLGDSATLGEADLPAHVLRPRVSAPVSAPSAAPTSTPAATPTSSPAPSSMSLRALEKEGILRALAATSGNKAQAAALLGIDRTTLYKKLRDYDLER